MINETLREELKGAGYVFPVTYKLETNSTEGEPTLEQLIDACTSRQQGHFSLSTNPFPNRRPEEVWVASFKQENVGWNRAGTTPVEAVANLFVAMNKKPAMDVHIAEDPADSMICDSCQ